VTKSGKEGTKRSSELAEDGCKAGEISSRPLPPSEVGERLAEVGPDEGPGLPDSVFVAVERRAEDEDKTAKEFENDIVIKQKI
jgi:hypothetical protein